jgi:hypothetical protein
MSVRIEIFDGLTPMLEKIALVSRGVALECLSVAGAQLQKQARMAMRRKQHYWHNEYVGGKRKIFKSTSQARELGLRISSATGSVDDPASMANFISSYLDEQHSLVVVGGKHKSFVPKKRENGEVVGTMPRVKGIGTESHAILHKLNFGELLPEYPRVSMPRFRNAKYVGYHFMEDGWRAAQGAIEDSLTRRYEAIIGKAVNRANVKTRKRTFA